jgi:hypothetical protein
MLYFVQIKHMMYIDQLINESYLYLLCLCLSESCLDYGPLYSFWCFSFERMNGTLGDIPHNNRSAEETFARRFFAQQAMSTWGSIMINPRGGHPPMTLQSLAERLGFPMASLPPLLTNEQVTSTQLRTESYWDSTRKHFPLYVLGSSSQNFVNSYIDNHRTEAGHHPHNRASARLHCIFCRFVLSDIFTDLQEEVQRLQLLPENAAVDGHRRIAIDVLPTSSAKALSECKHVINHTNRDADVVVFKRNPSHFATANNVHNVWTAVKLHAAIHARFHGGRFTALDSFSADDMHSKVHIIMPHIRSYKSFQIATGERVDSLLWSRQARSNVLVVCSQRDMKVVNYMRRQDIHPREQPWSNQSFPAGKQFLHPASIVAFLAVNYIVVSRQYADENPHADFLRVNEDRVECNMMSKEAYFAVCDFYKPNQLRENHPTGGLAEVWSEKFFDMGMTDNCLAEHIVPVNRLAGKFCKASYSKLTGATVAEEHANRDSLMMVLRLPFRV